MAPGNKEQGCTTDEKAMENAQERQSEGKHWSVIHKDLLQRQCGIPSASKSV